MPPRKPPHSLMTTCMGVISNAFLDVIVDIEDGLCQDKNSVLNKKVPVNEDYDRQPCEAAEIKLCRETEVEIANYLLSNLPSALLSVLLSEIIKEFASRWCRVIEASESKTNVRNENGVW